MYCSAASAPKGVDIYGSNVCNDCEGFGIDAIYSSKTYYAALRSPNGSYIVVGSFP